MKSGILSIIFGFLGLTVLAVETVNDFDVAVEFARKAEKNVLIIFTVDECDYCEKLKQDFNSFANINNYVVCVLNSREHKRLTGKMGIRKWPTSIIISVGKEGYGEASRIIGYGSIADYDRWLKANAEFFGSDDACGCDCADNCSCRKNDICTCCKDKCKCKK